MQLGSWVISPVRKSRPFNFDHIQILQAAGLLNANLIQAEATLPSMDIRITSRGD